jgi:hypothetical protein
MRRAILLLLAGLAIGAPAARAADVPTLVRDVKTGRYTLGTRDPKAPESDYVQPDTQTEPSIAVNPQNPDNVVAGYQEGRIDSGGDATNGFATTFDGGRTWKAGEIPGLTNFPGQSGVYDRASDAVVAFGPDNVVYYNSLVFNSETDATRSAITVNVSKDGGRTWGAPVVFQDDNIGGLNDKNWIVVDNSDAPGHKKGRVYVVWDRVAPIVYDYCDHDCDQLANWLPNLATVPGLIFPGQGLGAYPVITKGGGLGMAITMINGALPVNPLINTDQPDPEEIAGLDEQEAWILAPAAGTTPFPAPLAFEPPVQIGRNRSNGQPAQRGADGIPSAAVNPKTGAIHVVWDDGAKRAKANDVVISSSTDDGATWSAPAPVNPGPRDDAVNHYGASIAAGADGRLHVGYRVRDESPPGPIFSPFIDSYHQQSADDGKTWTDPLKIDIQPSHALYGAFSRQGTFEGDYDQIDTSGPNSYFVRCQGQPDFPGEKPALEAGTPTTLTFADADRGHQHQSCWVALVKDLPPGSAVDVPAPTPKPSGSLPTKLLKLSLTRRRFPGRRLRVRLAGATPGSVRSVSFHLGKRRIGRDTKPPFEHFVRVARRHGTLVVRAEIVLSDGRKVSLRRTLARRTRG